MPRAACRGAARGLATAGDGAGAFDGEPASSNDGELVVGGAGVAHGHGGHCGNVVVDCLELYLPGCRGTSRTRAAWINLPMIKLADRESGEQKRRRRTGQETRAKPPTTGVALLGGSAVCL
jgi:hypothetical protein